MERQSVALISLSLVLPLTSFCGIKFATARRPSARRTISSVTQVRSGTTAVPAAYAKEHKLISTMGRNILIGMVQANTEREAVGMGPVWPRTRGSNLVSDDRDDISGMTFDSAGSYFCVLLDAKNGMKSPYVHVDPRCIGGLSGGSVGWSVAANVTDKTPDTFPLLISANVNPFQLVLPGDIDSPIPFGSRAGRGGPDWADAFAVVVQKGGAVKTYGPGQFTKRNVLGGPAQIGMRFLSAPPPCKKVQEETRQPSGTAPATGTRWVMRGEQLVSFDEIAINSPRSGKKDDMYTVRLKKPYFIFREVMVEVHGGKVRNLMFQAEARQLRTESMAIGDAIAKDISNQCGIQMRSDGFRCHREYKWTASGFRSFQLNVNNENDDAPGSADFSLIVCCGAN